MSVFLFSSLAIFLQFIYSFFSLRQIRPEEISESVRSVYWFGERLVYEGLSTHLGWYAPLLVIYKMFGFQIDTAKWWRFGLWTVAVVCLSLLLKKYGGKFWWLIFLMIVTSPTLLYFNQLSTHYGVDVSFLLICLWLLSKLQAVLSASQGQAMPGKAWPYKTIILSCLLWFTAMWGWLSYPTFIYYLPALTFLFIKATSCSLARGGLVTPVVHYRGAVLHVFICILSFLLPLILGFSYIQNRHLLIFDPQDHGGVFRGSGKWDINPGHMALRVGETIKTFIVQTPNYYYEISWPEFGFTTPLVIFLVVYGVRLSLVNRGKRVILLGLGSVFAANLLALMLFVDTGGTWASVRRATGILVGIYGLSIIGLVGLQKGGKRVKAIGVFCCAIIIIYHLIAYYFNWSILQKPSQHQEIAWFSAGQNPQRTLEQYLAELQTRDLYLRCPFQEGVVSDCSYSRIFAALAGSCTWNGLKCHRIWGDDPQSGGFIPMKLSLWDQRWTWDKADSEIH